MTIDKQTAIDLITGDYKESDWMVYDTVVEGPAEDNQGIEKYCIIEYRPTSQLYRFIYVDTGSTQKLYYKKVQLTKVKSKVMTVTVYEEDEEISVEPEPVVEPESEII